jgi:hypothetical protein
MPTIDQLPAATAATDSDELPTSQTGILKRVTRAQITAGLQPTISLAAGQLLGRTDLGTGAPQPISIGANLTLAAGQLSVTAQSVGISGLPAAAAPSAPDRVAMSQSGTDTALPYSQFMAGLSTLSGVDGSNLRTLATGTITTRRLADQAADATPIEAFGAAGDGLTDDSAAVSAALASGRPVRFGPKTYLVNGPLTISGTTQVILGVPGQTILRRARQTGGIAWITIASAATRVDGIIFDANAPTITADSAAISLATTSVTSDWHRCVIQNAGGATQGHGLVIQASDPTQTQHMIRDCEFARNALHGLWVQACSGVMIQDSRAHDNAQHGFCLDFADTSFTRKIRLSRILGCRAWANQRGISVGNFNATNTTTVTYGLANPDAISVLVSNNTCHDNTQHGIFASGSALLIHANQLSGNGTSTAGSGITANVTGSRITSNTVVGSSAFGIDGGGSSLSDITQNQISGTSVGINCGGSSGVRVHGNIIQSCPNWAIQANNVETDAVGINYGLACQNLALTENWIAMNSASAGGIVLRDAPLGVLVARNSFIGTGSAAIANAFWPNTEAVITEGNRWNFTQRFYSTPSVINGLSTLLVPDIADSVMLIGATATVQSILTNYQVQTAGQLTFIRVAGGGYGYTYANVSIAGTGTGATARAILSGGSVLGIVVTSSGSGYGPSGTQLAVTISGDGTGAVAVGYCGTPVIEERRLLVRCNSAASFPRSGSQPLQDNWFGGTINAPIATDVEWIGTWGSWRAARFVSADNLAPDSSGGAILRTVSNADLQLRPGGTGHLRLTTDSETTGVTTAIGRGAPEGSIVAPPGSTYSNLNGGTGTSFYVKRSGTGPTGWFAIG